MKTIREIKHFHFCCGCGGGARGFNKGTARVGNVEARFRCIGGIDNDPAAIANFDRLAGVKGTVLDLFSRDQYTAFHGREPSSEWREATPLDIQRAAGFECPDIVFISAPCKGFSGLLSQSSSQTPKYQALNELTLRCVWLMLETWKDNPPSLIIFENVPRIQTRGAHLLELIKALFRAYGYIVAETVHDCGEIGGLAQSRKRFLMVARHAEKIPNFLYEPPKQRLRGVGEVLDRMPLPGDPAGGFMHRVPALQWKTWVRLAFVEAGSDWRSLNRLNVEDGFLKDFLILPERQNGFLGVHEWSQPSGTVRGRSLPNNGAFSVADMRAPHNAGQYQQFGVMRYDETAATVTSQRSPGQGTFSVADPRIENRRTAFSTQGEYGVNEWEQSTGTVKAAACHDNGRYSVADPRHIGPAKHSNEYRIIAWDKNANACTSAHGTGQCVADPLPRWENRYGNMKVGAWEDPAGTVIAGGKGVQGGWMSVADPRPAGFKGERPHYNSQGHYGVLDYADPSGAVSAAANHDNGPWSVADPRGQAMLPESSIILPEQDERLTCIIRSMDGTWHRPFTTLELMALQSLIDPEDPQTWTWVGNSDGALREQCGNAVPSESAEAVASVMGETILLAEQGESFQLSNTPIWVRPLAAAVIFQPGAIHGH